MRRAHSMALLQQESKGLFYSLETSPHRYRSLKAHLQPKLKIAWIQSATRLAEVPKGILVVSSFQRSLARGRQDKVGAVKHVEAFSPELHTDSLRDLKVLEQRHVRIPLAGTNEGVATEVSG